MMDCLYFTFLESERRSRGCEEEKGTKQDCGNKMSKTKERTD